jgi:hypothetical protein
MARKRFGQLSKKRKAKIRARAKNEGLTKKQVRKQFNAKRDSNKDKLSASKNPFGTKSKIPKFVAARAQRTAPATTTQSRLRAAGADETDLRSGDINRYKLSASNNTRPAAATTTQSQLRAAGADETDLRSGKITGGTTGAEYDLSDKSDLGYMQQFDSGTYNRVFGTNQTTDTLPSGSGPDTLGGGNGPDTLDGGNGTDTIPQTDPKDIYPDLPAFLKNNATYLSGASAGGIRRRRSRRSKLGINAMGTNQLKRNFRNMLSIGGINI